MQLEYDKKEVELNMRAESIYAQLQMYETKNSQMENSKSELQKKYEDVVV